VPGPQSRWHAVHVQSARASVAGWPRRQRTRGSSLFWPHQRLSKHKAAWFCGETRCLKTTIRPQSSPKRAVVIARAAAKNYGAVNTNPALAKRGMGYPNGSAPTKKAAGIVADGSAERFLSQQNLSRASGQCDSWALMTQDELDDPTLQGCPLHEGPIYVSGVPDMPPCPEPGTVIEMDSCERCGCTYTVILLEAAIWRSCGCRKEKLST
jgi:hypothetical protein